MMTGWVSDNGRSLQFDYRDTLAMARGTGIPAFNRMKPEQNGRCFAEDIFLHIFMNENVRILNKISVKYGPRDPVDEKSALDQVMACCRQATSHYLIQCWPNFWDAA